MKLMGLDDTPAWLKDTPLENLRYVAVRDGENVDHLISRYGRSRLVEHADYVPVYSLQDWRNSGQKTYPSNWNSSRHWYFDRIGLPELFYAQGCHEGKKDCGGSEEVVVAIIASGLNFENHTSQYSSFLV